MILHTAEAIRIITSIGHIGEIWSGRYRFRFRFSSDWTSWVEIGVCSGIGSELLNKVRGTYTSIGGLIAGCELSTMAGIVKR